MEPGPKEAKSKAHQDHRQNATAMSVSTLGAQTTPPAQLVQVEGETQQKTSAETAINFSGVWISFKSQNLKNFLISQGHDEKLAEAAEHCQITQEIQHDEANKRFSVKTGTHTKTYAIGGGGNLHEVFGNTIFWDSDHQQLVSMPFHMNTSDQKVETRRRMEDSHMVLTVTNNKETAVRYFKRAPAPTSSII